LPKVSSGILNVFPEMSIARDEAGRFPFVYSQRERKSKIVEDLILYDRVYFRTEHFGELAWLCSWLPFPVIKDLLKNQSIVFLHDPWVISILEPNAYVAVHGQPIGSTIRLTSKGIFSGLILDACGLPNTINGKVASSLQSFTYNKSELNQIARIAEDTTIEITEGIIQQAKQSAESDIANRDFAAYMLKALSGDVPKGLPDEHVVVKANLYIATMAKLGNVHLHSPEIIQKTLIHKIRWLGKRLSLGEQTQQNLSTLFRVLNVPNIRVLYQKGAINGDNILEFRKSAKEFRHWLYTTIESKIPDSRSNEDLLRAYLYSVEKVSPLNYLPTKVIRFMVTSGVGFIPVIGSIASIGLSAFDTFLLERLVSGWSPKMFMDKLRKL
jgi:hypothetical protein